MMSYERSMTHLMNGEARKAVFELSDPTIAKEDSTLNRALLGCAHAILNNTTQAMDYLVHDEGSQDSHKALALRRTAEAYLSMHAGNRIESLGKLNEAMRLDSELPLPWLSLGLHEMRVSRDYHRAEELLRGALERAPSSSLVGLHLVGLHANKGEFNQALALIDEIPSVKSNRWRLRVIHSAFWLSSNPVRAGVVGLALGMLSLAPVVGPLLLVGGGVYAVIAFRYTYRLSGRVAVLPTIFLVQALIFNGIRLLLGF